MKSLDSYKKEKEFLVCVDSDGCVIDSMNWKHKECFGVEFIRVFGFEKVRDEFLKIWNDINLFSATRGINRFKGLVLALEIAREQKVYLEDFQNLKNWAEHTSELSNDSLLKEMESKEIAVHDSDDLKKAYEWSIAVNNAIASDKRETVIFGGSRDAIKEISKFADIAVVSSANEEAVLAEWHESGLDKYVNIFLTQKYGSKSDCIKMLLEYGYENKNVLMVGDAPGDYQAALSNNVWFYPILVEHEKESWKNIISECFSLVMSEKFSNDMQDSFVEKFNKNLNIN